MAAGDPLTAVILPNGNQVAVTFSGLGIGGTYAARLGLGVNNDPATGTPLMTATVTSFGHTGTTLGTKTRISYGEIPVRCPYSTATIAGTFNVGTFVDGETATQGTSGATAVILNDQSAGASLYVHNVAGTPDNSHVWTGGTSGATFTASATPVAFVDGGGFPALNERFDGTNTTIVFALSKSVYAKDKAGVGNSGTDVSIAFGAGIYTKSGTPTTAATLTATNSSTLAYPVVIGQWDHIAGRCTADRVAAPFSLAFNAAHGFGISAVRIDVTGATSAHNENSTITSETATVRTATGLYYPAFVYSAIPVGGFTVGELLNCRARAYPNIGDSTCVLDTDSHTNINEECRGYNKAVLVYSSTPKYAYISTTGNDATAVASTTQATALANPFLNPGKAIQNDATVIYGLAGVHPCIGDISSSRRATNEWYVIQPAPGETAATVIFQVNNTNKEYECQRLQYSGVTIQLNSDVGWLDGNNGDNNLRFTNCVFDSNGHTVNSAPLSYRSLVTYFENATGDLCGSIWQLTEFSTARVATQFDGVAWTEATAGASSMSAWFRIVANSGTGAVAFGETSTNDPAPTQDNVFFDCNSFANYNGTSTAFAIGTTRNISLGAAIRGNVLEKLNGTNPIMSVAADGSVSTVNHVIICNNTLAGGRINGFYNDTGTTAQLRSNIFSQNNLWESCAIKSDTFTNGAGIVQNGNRTGNWATLYGTNCSGNFSPHIADIGASGSFMFEYAAVKSYQPGPISGQPPGDGTNVHGYVAFVNRQAYDGGVGAGNGDYHLGPTSPALDFQFTQTMAFDLEGSERGSPDSPGAYTTFEPQTGGPGFLFSPFRF